MPPICVRTRLCISLYNLSSSTADMGCSGTDSVIKAKGSWPFRESGTPTTLASATRGWLVIACSIEPVTVD